MRDQKRWEAWAAWRATGPLPTDPQYDGDEEDDDPQDDVEEPEDERDRRYPEPGEDPIQV